MPNKKNIKKWTTRLRDPNLLQGFGQLGTADGKRCCLGVACDVAVEEGVINPPVTNMNGVLFYAGMSALLPLAVADWLGLSNHPILDLPSREDDIEALTLVGLNDEQSLSFSQIADLIDYTYLSDDSEDME